MSLFIFKLSIFYLQLLELSLQISLTQERGRKNILKVTVRKKQSTFKDQTMFKQMNFPLKS